MLSIKKAPVLAVWNGRTSAGTKNEAEDKPIYSFGVWKDSALTFSDLSAFKPDRREQEAR